MTSPDHYFNNREFDVISFHVRSGRIHKVFRGNYILLPIDNIPAKIAVIARNEVAKGLHVLVLESGVIKADWSRIHHNAFHALKTISRDDYRRLFAAVDSMRDVTLENFTGHFERSFPSGKTV